MGVMPVSALLGSYPLLGAAFQWAHLAGIALVLVGFGQRWLARASFRPDTEIVP
jgi:hypothetical protein